MAKKKIDKEEVLRKIILNENVYIFKKSNSRFLTNVAVNGLVLAAKKDKEDSSSTALFSIINESRKTLTDIDYKFTALVLKYISVPSFLSEYIERWEEQKLAYMFMLDFGQYLVIAKRNISGIQPFLNSLEPLPYEVLAKLFVKDNTLYEKFSLENLNISDKAMRSKAVEAENLSDNFNYVGSNTYVLNHLRLNNGSQRYAIALNSSRISKAGDKAVMTNFVEACHALVELVVGFIGVDCFLDVFAKPCDYEIERDNLQAISVTLLFGKLLNDILSNTITEVRYSHNDFSRVIDISKSLEGLSSTIEIQADPDRAYHYKSVTNPRLPLKELGVKLNEKSIRVSSKRLSNIILYFDVDDKQTLASYINDNCSFIVNFDNCEYVYTNRKLFKDSALLGNIDHFLQVFEPDVALDHVLSEKGTITNTSTAFDATSVFNFVEQKFSAEQYLILDDLGDEWADHIAITDSTITFIHSKYGDSIFSATAFADIVSQAQKNIGNMYGVDAVIQNKKEKWEDYFRLDGIQSQISRLRIGASVDDFVTRYCDVKRDAIPRRSIVLALNFISKAILTTNLHRLRNDEVFGDRKRAIQILWFLSSLIANCRDNSIELKIFCRP